ncbi:UPF0016-domain-containing protein, partial [Meredithblackwellia eburnea MCA 4105]
AVIVVSEIGDKTFLIAAILAMRHPRITVFMGAFAALAVMSLLSSLLGTIMPTLLPKRYTTAAAALLFFVFGARMLQEGLEMEAGEKGREKMEEEMREVQKEVEEAEEEAIGRAPGASRAEDMEEGRLEANKQLNDIDPEGGRASSPSGGSGGASRRGSTKRRNSLSMPSKEDAVAGLTEGAKNLCSLFFSPIFVQSFILTFLAEWGDRSQITTIALAAAHNVWLVTFGTTLGHSFCTMLAVLGGRWISQRISIKHVTLGGAVLFLIFGLIYSFEAYNWEEVAEVPAVSLSEGLAA